MYGRDNDRQHDHSGAGYRNIHTAIDDPNRIAYSEIHNNEQAVAAERFWTRAAAWYRSIGITPQRAIADHGSNADIDHLQCDARRESALHISAAHMRYQLGSSQAPVMRMNPGDFQAADCCTDDTRAASGG